MGQESEEGERETEKRERGERSKRNKEEVEKEEEEVEKTMRAIEWPKRRTDAIQSFRLLSFFLSFSLFLSLSLFTSKISARPPPHIVKKKEGQSKLTLATAGSANDDAAGPSLALPLGPAAPLPPRASTRAWPPDSTPTACARGRASGADASRQARSSGGSRVFEFFFSFLRFDREF